MGESCGRILWENLVGESCGLTGDTKDGSFSITLLYKHSHACHAHKRNATEVTKLWLK